MGEKHLALPPAGRKAGRRAPFWAVLALVVFCSASLSLLSATPSVSVASRETALATPVPTLSDNFTHDSVLNASLWQVSGPVGLDFGNRSCAGCTTVSLDPSFSAAGMEIAQINGSAEVGTIQSIASFSAPLTVTAVVKGTVSNGHPFVFGISTTGAESGVQITGNLNPDDCSNETNCGNPATCGNPAAPSIPPNQCYYGIYARTGTGGSTWTKSPFLNTTPSIGMTYSLEIAVDESGAAQFSVIEGGQTLGTGTVQVGAGPFYLIIAQSEGAPVPGPGPNQAFWSSVSLTPAAATPPGSPSTSPSLSISSTEWVVFIVIIALVLLALLLATRRRRDLSVEVLDSGTLSPVPGAGVSANGPENLSSRTGSDGIAGFGRVKRGDYSVLAGADGYAASEPATVSVKRSTRHTVKLGRPPSVGQEGVASQVPEASLGQASEAAPPVGASPPPGPGPTPSVAGASLAAAGAASSDGLERLPSARVREIARTFLARGAVSPETALTAEELGLSRVFVRAMKRRRGRTRVFREINGRYYLDQTALQEME